MSNAFKCDVCGSLFELQPLKNFIGGDKEDNVQANLQLFMFNKQGSLACGLEQWDLCPKCYKKLKEFLRNENVENETSEETVTDVKEISYEEARKILESEWCCKCRRYINGKCDKRLSKGIKNCIDYVLENKIPVHFDRKFEPEVLNETNNKVLSKE